MSLTTLKTKAGKDDRVLVTIVTDGCENSSREYSGKTIKALVDELKFTAWIFAYIGANHDVEKFANSISITNTLTFHATHHGMHAMTGCASSSRMRFFDRLKDKKFDYESENSHFFDEES